MPRCGTLGDLSVHSIPPTIRAAKRCTGNKAARVAGAVHSPNSAKKFNIPARAINGKDSKSARQRLFCACKTKNERGDLSLSHAWYGGRIPGNTGYMGALACAGSNPAAPSFVRARSCPKRKKPGLNLGFHYVMMRAIRAGWAGDLARRAFCRGRRWL